MIGDQALLFRELPCDDDDTAITEVGHGTSFEQTSRLEPVVPSNDTAAHGQVRCRHDVDILKTNRHCVVHGALLLGVRAEHTWEGTKHLPSSRCGAVNGLGRIPILLPPARQTRGEVSLRRLRSARAVARRRPDLRRAAARLHPRQHAGGRRLRVELVSLYAAFFLFAGAPARHRARHRRAAARALPGRRPDPAAAPGTRAGTHLVPGRDALLGGQLSTERLAFPEGRSV